jgi:pyruvate/2-oxoglutarate/acetoin dehydrogenase E1 component
MEKVLDNLNRALHTIFGEDPRVCLIGEDLLDPYGGAFKVAKGLSTAYPDRVHTTPLSESGFTGVAAGMALAGEKPIVEVMFGDFIALAIDPIVNFAAKSVTMYGRRIDLTMLVRCPVGGQRAYGPTHSQAMQKYFVGTPNLTLHELSPVHDCEGLLRRTLAAKSPAILFEDKAIYAQPMLTGAGLDPLFSRQVLDEAGELVLLERKGQKRLDCLLVAPGGLVKRALAAAKTLLIEDEIDCSVLVSSRIYPFPWSGAKALVAKAKLTVAMEDGTPGGSWTTELAQLAHTELWGKLQKPVRLLSAKDTIIPCAAHLEKTVLLQETDIVTAVKKELL